eukprot:403361669
MEVLLQLWTFDERWLFFYVKHTDLLLHTCWLIPILTSLILNGLSLYFLMSSLPVHLLKHYDKKPPTDIVYLFTQYYAIQASILLLNVITALRQIYIHIKGRRFQNQRRQLHQNHNQPQSESVQSADHHNYWERRCALFSVNGIMLFSLSSANFFWLLLYFLPKLKENIQDCQISWLQIKFIQLYAMIQTLVGIFIIVVSLISIAMKGIPMGLYQFGPKIIQLIRHNRRMRKFKKERESNAAKKQPQSDLEQAVQVAQPPDINQLSNELQQHQQQQQFSHLLNPEQVNQQSVQNKRNSVKDDSDQRVMRYERFEDEEEIEEDPEKHQTLQQYEMNQKEQQKQQQLWLEHQQQQQQQYQEKLKSGEIKFMDLKYQQVLPQNFNKQVEGNIQFGSL